MDVAIAAAVLESEPLEAPAASSFASREEETSHGDQSAVEVRHVETATESGRPLNNDDAKGGTSRPQRSCKKLSSGGDDLQLETSRRPGSRQDLKRKSPRSTRPGMQAYDLDFKSPYLYSSELTRAQSAVSPHASLPLDNDPDYSPLRKQVKLEPMEMDTTAPTDSLVVAGLALGTAFSLATTVVFPSAAHTLDGLCTIKQEPEDGDWSEEVITPDVSHLDPLEDPLSPSRLLLPPPVVQKPFTWPQIDPLFLTQIEFRLPKEFAPFLRALAKPTAEILPLVQEATAHSPAAACKPPAPEPSRLPSDSHVQAAKAGGGIQGEEAETSTGLLRRSARQAQRDLSTVPGELRGTTHPDPEKKEIASSEVSLGSTSGGTAGGYLSGDTMLNMVNQLAVFSTGEVTILRVSAPTGKTEEPLTLPPVQASPRTLSVTPIDSNQSVFSPTAPSKPQPSISSPPPLRPEKSRPAAVSGASLAGTVSLAPRRGARVRRLKGGLQHPWGDFNEPGCCSQPIASSGNRPLVEARKNMKRVGNESGGPGVSPSAELKESSSQQQSTGGTPSDSRTGGSKGRRRLGTPVESKHPHGDDSGGNEAGSVSPTVTVIKLFSVATELYLNCRKFVLR